MDGDARLEEIKEFKTQADRLLCEFFTARLGRGPRHLRRRTARALWEIVARPLPNKDLDAPWPFWRICFRLLDRAQFDDVRGNEPELTLNLLALGFPDDRNALDVWKHRIKEGWLMTLSSRGLAVDFSSESKFIRNALPIWGKVRKGELPSGLAETREALGIRTDWEDAIFEAVRSLAAAGSLIAALYPPGHEELLSGLCAAILNELPGRAVRVALEEQEELGPLVQRWEAESLRPWLVVIPEAERFTDLEDALDRLRSIGWNTLVICRAEEALGEQSKLSCVLPLGALSTASELSNQDNELLEPARQRVQSQDVFDTICLFTALHRKPLVAQVARICGCTELLVRQVVEDSGGLLAFDPHEPQKVMRGDEGWAARHLFRLCSLEELAGKYARVVDGLRPEDPEDRRAVRNLFTSWFRLGGGPQRPLWLARAVLEQTAGKVLSFARLEDSAATGARRRWAEILAWMGEYQKAHDLFLETDRTSEEVAVESLNAAIFKLRFRDSGRTLFYRLAESIYEELISRRPPTLDSLREALADLYRLAGEPKKGLVQLGLLASPAFEYRRALSADLLVAGGQRGEAEEAAKALPRRRLHRVLLERLRGDDWREYVDFLLNSNAHPSPAALEQAAVRALERGLFDDAEKLLECGLRMDPDNLYLNASRAQLFHERGQYSEAVRQYDQILPKQRHFGALAGPEADVLRLARLDSALELFRASQDAQHLPQHKPAPLTQQKPPEKERSESYYLHLVALEAKLHWYGAIPDSSFGGNLPALADAIVARRRHPVLLNLAAKILADDSVRNFEQARVYVMEALGSAQGQARIRTLNTLAWLWEREGETLPRQEPARKQCCFQEALAALQESQKLDPENTFTGTALERVAARLRGLTG